MYNKREVTCRRCKEENNWEIESPDGKVMSKHYPSKEECLQAGLKYAEEYGCDLHLCCCKCNNYEEE